jgi:hypothetical protein
VHKQADLGGTALASLEFPMIETQDEWLMSGFSYPNPSYGFLMG